MKTKKNPYLGVYVQAKFVVSYTVTNLITGIKTEGEADFLFKESADRFAEKIKQDKGVFNVRQYEK